MKQKSVDTAAALLLGAVAWLHAPSVPARPEKAGARTEPGREANIAVRDTPPRPAAMRSGPYPPGEPVPERPVDGGVAIAGHRIKEVDYDALRRSGFVPMRRELTDAELVALLAPAFRKRLATPAALAAHSRTKFADYVPFLYWGFRERRAGAPASRALETYEQHVTAAGELREAYRAMTHAPAIAMMRWAASYWTTGEAMWARAVRDAFLVHYHANRPPLNKIRNTKARGPWHVLALGSKVPFLVEAYAMVCDSPDWRDEDHLCFWKSMVERARFLRYTTVPTLPWPTYNVFGYGNWLLYQLEGLLAIAAYFPEFAEADDWLAHATRGIGEHADWVVFPDGGFDEYSTSYLGQVAGQFEYCYNVFGANRLSMPDRFRENVLRLHELFLKTAHPAGHRIPFGDTHRGGDIGPSRARWASLAFLDGRFKHLGGELDEEYVRAGARVLHPENPEAAIERLQSLAPIRPTQQSHVVPECGWTVMRSGWAPEATVVALPFRASARVFHSGWEMLGLNLWARGEPVLTKLMGFRSYTSGYPEGYCRTPLQANHVVLQGGKLRRVAGSLRNWHTSATLDYVHADHRGWNDGAVTSRRRLLFVKPDWLVIVDDLQGTGDAAATWQAHTDESRPALAADAATVSGGAAQVRIRVLGTPVSARALPVTGMDKTVYLLEATRAGAFPLRFLTLVHVGSGEIDVATSSADGVVTLRFHAGNGPVHVVRCEAPDADGARFLEWRNARGAAFLASDGNPSPALDRMVAAADVDALWNGRALLLGEEPSAPRPKAGRIDPDDVRAFTYHGRIELTPVGTAARVRWRTAEQALHCVLYRRAGEAVWQRQVAPGPHRSAWVLLPDLVPGADYELRVASELVSGQRLVSPVFTRRAPAEWDPFR